jgi:hypothetical protein
MAKETPRRNGVQQNDQYSTDLCEEEMLGDLKEGDRITDGATNKPSLTTHKKKQLYHLLRVQQTQAY